MRNWWMKTLLAAALAYPTGALLAQPQQQPPAPAPAQPAPAPQPANDGDPGDEADAARAGEAVREDQRAMEMRLRELAEQQRAVAVRAQQGAIAEVDALRRFKGKTEKAAWLGVSTSKVPQALRHHAKLKNKYTGLIVERVEPGSPADTAGLEQFDIIEKVGDQWIVNTEQFSVVLRMQQPGTEVSLSIIREGQPQELKAKLAEKELPVLGAGGAFEAIGVPAIAQGGANWIDVAPQGRFVFRHGQLEPLFLDRLNDADESQITIKDDEHTLKMTTKDGERHLVASDANGVVIFDGPINTDEERGNVPEEIREKVEKLEDGPNGLKATRKGPATAPANEKD